MAGKYAVPEEIRAIRPEGTVVKKLNGGCYVYETKSTSVKVEDENGLVRWKTKTKSGPCIGKIVPGQGFVPNARRVYEDETDTLTKTSMSVQDVVERYGSTLVDPALISVYDAIEGAHREEAKRMAVATRRGADETHREDARRLKELGVGTEIISKACGLTIQDIDALQARQRTDTRTFFRA